MRITSKKVISFFCVFCLFSLILCTGGGLLTSSAEVEWEREYFKTQTDYYAGDSTKAISVEDSTFEDWKTKDLVRIDSGENPENWQLTSDLKGVVYSYSFAWNETYLFYYIKIDMEMVCLNNNCPRLYLDVSPGGLNKFTGFVEFNYDSLSSKMIITRATYGTIKNNDYTNSIKYRSAEIDGCTHIEAAIPWSKMGEAISIETLEHITYNMYISKKGSALLLFPQDTSVWTQNNQPWLKSTHYLNLHLCKGVPVCQPATPTPLTLSEIPSESFIEVNSALGKVYSGTAGTDPDWQESNGTILTEGSFGSTGSINGYNMEGFTQTDIEDEGCISKIVDLGENVSGLYKFGVGTAQIATEGIVFPGEVKVYASVNGFHYQYLGSTEALGHESSGESVIKETRREVLTLTEGVEARYIKYKIIPPEESYSLIAVSELTAIHNVTENGDQETNPVLSLGAKVNKEMKGLRFGARFTRDKLKQVERIGMLVYPTAKLGDNTLDMNYYHANAYSETNEAGVVYVKAVAISKSDFVKGYSFEDYEAFTYFISLLDIPDDQLSTNITAVPVIEYVDGSVYYGTPLVRNYNEVLALTDAIEE